VGKKPDPWWFETASRSMQRGGKGSARGAEKPLF
jgi:hypothetical protein